MNIENEMWDKLKAEIKSELKDEIKAELIADCKEEIVKSAMKKVDDLIFIDRYFETMLRTYIKSLCYDDIHFERMKNLGLAIESDQEIDYWKSSTGKIWMALKKDIDVAKIYSEHIAAGNISCTQQEFNSVINFDHISPPIIWNQEARGSFSYKGVFKLYENVYDFDFSQIDAPVIYHLINFIRQNFIFEGSFKSYYLIRKSFIKAYKPKKRKV